MRMLYCLTSLAHKRVFQSFVEELNHEYLVVGPKSIIFDGIVPEDYSEFGIKNIYQYNSIKEIQKKVNEFCPDFYLQADISPIQKNINLPKTCKRIYVSHGLIPNYAANIYKELEFKRGSWGGCNLYCGGTNIFYKWIKFAAGVSDKNILLNAIPQLDIIFNIQKKSKELYRNNIIKHTKNPNASCVLFFGGFCCKDRIDFLHHNEDYFKSCIELEKLASKNNWLVFVKPRQTYEDTMGFLIRHKNNWGGWTKKYIHEYARIQNSKYMYFIKTSGGLHYYYHISDVMLINGCSTIEIEAYALGKPLIIINSNLASIGSDSFDTKSDAAHRIDDFSKLEDNIIRAIENPTEKLEGQEAVIRRLGLTIDGSMHNRVYKKLLEL